MTKTEFYSLKVGDYLRAETGRLCIVTSKPTRDASLWVYDNVQHQNYSIGFPPSSVYYSMHLELNASREEKEELCRQKVLYEATVLRPMLGSDPEVFVFDSAGKLLPAWTFLPYGKPLTKYAPFADGFQAEFAAAPDFCQGYFVDNLQKGLIELHKAAQVACPGSTIVPVDVVELSKYERLNTPDDYIQLGCSLSLNAYRRPSLRIRDPRKLRLRFAGAHFHYGFGDPGKTDYVPYVKALDQVAGVCYTGLLEDLEDPRRRKYYGRAGEYRLPKYGFEWRVPSCTLLRHPMLWHLAGDIARLGMWMCEKKYLHYWQRVSDKEVQRIINTSDVEAARKVIETNRELLETFFTKRYTKGGASAAMQMLLQGVQKSNLPLDNMCEAWYLEGRWSPHSDDSRMTFANYRRYLPRKTYAAGAS